MSSPGSWWWPNRPARVPKARTAGLLAGLGTVLFGASALLVKTGATGWDARLFRVLNEVPPAAASVLTPLSYLFRPAGIIAVVTLTVVYVVARNRGLLPVAAGAGAAGAAWVLANVAKVVADRPRPYNVMADAVLRQQPAHGTSFPSSHTAVTLAVVIALVPFLTRLLAAAGITYAGLVGWSRVYLGVHYPLDVLAGAGIGMAVGGAILLALRTLLRRAGLAAGGHNNAADVRTPNADPETSIKDDLSLAITARADWAGTVVHGGSIRHIGPGRTNLNHDARRASAVGSSDSRVQIPDLPSPSWSRASRSGAHTGRYCSLLVHFPKLGLAQRPD